MSLPRFLPHLAIASIVVSGATLAVALTRTPSAASEPVAEAPEAPEAPAKTPAVQADPPTMPKRAASAAAAATATTAAPTVRGVKAEARTVRQRAELALEVALGLPDGLAANDRLSVTARCLVDGAWSDARASIRTGNLGAGERVVKQSVYLKQLPSTCHLVFARDRAAIAHLCWTGGTVVDKPCDPVARAADKQPLAVTALRVTAKAQRRGTAHDLAIELEGTLASKLDGNLELSASCVVPSGAPQVDRTRVYLPRDPGAVSRKSRLFARSRLPEAPQRCTLTLELADRTGAIREPLATKCWRDGAVTDGACA